MVSVLDAPGSEAPAANATPKPDRDSRPGNPDSPSGAHFHEASSSSRAGRGTPGARTPAATHRPASPEPSPVRAIPIDQARGPALAGVPSVGSRPVPVSNDPVVGRAAVALDRGQPLRAKPLLRPASARGWIPCHQEFTPWIHPSRPWARLRSRTAESSNCKLSRSKRIARTMGGAGEGRVATRPGRAGLTRALLPGTCEGHSRLRRQQEPTSGRDVLSSVGCEHGRGQD